MNDYLSESFSKKLVLKFLVCCYFGQTENIVKAAIDRAYVDMAAHTMTEFSDDQNNDNKWECRYQTGRIIEEEIKEYSEGKSFEKWHSSVIKRMKDVYEQKGKALSEGQAQKWLNMVIKYLYVFYKMDYISEGLPDWVIKFFSCTTEKMYYPPIDSYILKRAEIDGSFDSWSKLEKRNIPRRENEQADKHFYDDMVTAFEAKLNLSNDHGFLWELENWQFTVGDKAFDKGSYAEYYSKRIMI